MNDEDITKLVTLIEDGICQNVNIDDYEEIMPKVATILFNRYCVVKSDLKLSDLFEMFNNVKTNIINST